MHAIRALFASLLLLFAVSAQTAEYTGIWWDSAKSGQGVNLHHEGSTIFGAWYLYDVSGLGMWVTIEGGSLVGNVVTAELREYSGPALGASWDTKLVQATKVGTVTITFHSGSSASFAYTLGSASGTLNLVRFGDKTLHLDGIYQGTAISSQAIVGGTVCGTAVMAFAVVDHTLSGFALDSDSEFYNLSATVSSSGSIASGAFAQASTNYATFDGTVNGTTGNGTWKDIYNCSGTWSVVAQ